MAAIIVVPSAPPSGRNSSMGKSHVVLPLSRETTFITTLLSGDRAGHKLGLPPTRFPSADHLEKRVASERRRKRRHRRVERPAAPIATVRLSPLLALAACDFLQGVC